MANDYNLVRDRARENIVPPRRFGQADLIYYALNVGEEIQGDEPSNFKEALDSKERQEWLEAMNEEIHSLHKNMTWILVDPPKGQKIIVANGFLRGRKKLKMIRRSDSKQG